MKPFIKDGWFYWLHKDNFMMPSLPSGKEDKVIDFCLIPNEINIYLDCESGNRYKLENIWDLSKVSCSLCQK